MNLPPGYDAWRTAGPEDERPEIGTEEGDTCNRYPEPDEDAPRGYKPKPCAGVMGPHLDCRTGQSWIECDTCGEEA